MLSPHRSLRFAIGELNRGEGAAVLLDQDTGGTHCCRNLVAITPSRSGWRIVDLGDWDGTPPDFPRDLSGDGRGDLVLRDDRFNYAFASYAASWTPPRIFNVVGGRRIEVSAMPGFAPLFRRHMAAARIACERPKRDNTPNGACAAYAADAARLGRLREAWPVVLRSWKPFAWKLPEGCRVARVAGECPAGARIIHRDYPTALRGFLLKNGYLSKR